jgi:hypothetical protein
MKILYFIEIMGAAASHHIGLDRAGEHRARFWAKGARP